VKEPPDTCCNRHRHLPLRLSLLPYAKQGQSGVLRPSGEHQVSERRPGHSPPPPERGRSATEGGRVGVTRPSRFNRTPEKTARARQLRRASTDVEMRLWQKLRHGQIVDASFRRQHPAGPYILDFYCPALRFAIELDGGQHASSLVKDARRDEWLRRRGVTVLRFWNSDITENLSGVLEVIAARISELMAQAPTPTRRWRADLPLSGGGALRPGRDSQ
jgi:very-short-patch-repair endonuclease